MRCSNYRVKFISKDNDIISFTLTSLPTVPVKQRSKLIFRDSALLLPSSLQKLGESFSVPVVKGVFPYSFVTGQNLNYNGALPEYEYFNSNQLSRAEYEKISLQYKDNGWSMRYETLSYLNKDLISLHQIITKMSDEIFNKYQINITNHSTLSGLALAIYRSNFMPADSKIVRVKGRVEKAIRSAYYGGAVDVYRPQGENLYYYDANSLYPAAMLQPMPVGEPTYSTNKNLNEIFGFVRATVTSPNLYNPTLPCKVGTHLQ